MVDESPKIFIDEGWKAQVQREKEEAARKAAEAEQSAVIHDAPEGAEEDGGEEGGFMPADDPASFLGLVQSLATQGLLMLGLIAAPDSKQVMVDINSAKLIIDTLLMLREKTKGNLTADEAGQLSEIVAELQHFYVMRAQQVQAQTLRQAGVDPTNLKGM